MARHLVRRPPAGLLSEARVAGRQVILYFFVMYSVIAYPSDPVLGYHDPRYRVLTTDSISIPDAMSGVMGFPLFPPFESREDAEFALSNAYLHPYDLLNPWMGAQGDIELSLTPPEVEGGW